MPANLASWEKKKRERGIEGNMGERKRMGPHQSLVLDQILLPHKHTDLPDLDKSAVFHLPHQQQTCKSHLRLTCLDLSLFLHLAQTFTMNLKLQ